MPAAGAADMDWVDFAVEHEIDLLAVSFVRRAADLEPVERAAPERGSDIPLIAKIEKPQAAEHAEEIVEAATSGIMVARGDLGIELPIEEVPGGPEAPDPRSPAALEARRSPRPRCSPRWSTATAPTRAEVTDVANAIYDGTDAVMLSEETAVGDHPVEAVAVMDRIARATEPRPPLRGLAAQPGRDADDDVVGLGRPGRRRRRPTGSASRRSSSRPAAAGRRGSSRRIRPRGAGPRDLAAASRPCAG